MKQPTNIHVDNYEPTTGRAAAGWEMDGARFHVWFNAHSMNLIPAAAISKDLGKLIVYKNPLVERGDPDFFDTRKLDATSKANNEILCVVFEEIEKRGLIAVAKAAFEEKERQRRQATEEYRRQERIKEAANLLFDACEAAEKVLVEGSHVMVHAQLRAALTKARGE